MEIHLPSELAVMTLPQAVFFPQALLPLHIFEPRYRRMLEDMLGQDRMFAVAGLDESRLGDPARPEPLHRVATAGIIRACQKNDNGTSNLLLQGLCRIEVLEILEEEPYRRIHVRPLLTQVAPKAGKMKARRADLVGLTGTLQKLGAGLPAEMTKFLGSIDDLDTFVDLAAFNVCEDAGVKQRLLETLDTQLRLDRLIQYLRRRVDTLRLQKNLQGGLSDEDIAQN